MATQMNRQGVRSGEFRWPRIRWKGNRASSLSIGGFLCFLSFVLGCAVLLPGEVVAQGCAMCRTVVGGPDDPLTQAFNTSILFLMSMPFVLAASVGTWLVYMHWRGRGNRAGFQEPQLGREEQS